MTSNKLYVKANGNLYKETQSLLEVILKLLITLEK